ncbi:cellulose synthase-like protein [Musa troglodytarum]|uniref:Cellulose synthase-like protein n=1 Tax=Musa troglodytarum TaxID=320322 RepID=A0A9E7EMN7_9LILI|nr:cellulose synthase-like protein [Musa troglodytarum]
MLPLQERVPLKNSLQKLSDALVLSLLLSLLAYRLVSLHRHAQIWLLAFACESWFTFVWLLNMNAKWTRVAYKTFPRNLSTMYHDLPAVDVFVTTADPTLEPPVITANTVLSLLAVEYPCRKLSCYVSDDAASPITFYSLVESAEFAKLWVPFCKKHNVRVRAPSVYFSTTEPQPSHGLSSDFTREWRRIKDEYEELIRRIETANEDQIRSRVADGSKEFPKTDRRDHPSMVEVIWENKEGSEDGFPHLIYVAREKTPRHSHRYKAGAMNALTRVSGVMTNAPFMLNVDCDMFANNPEVVLHAMCLLLGVDDEVFAGFAQAPQQFYGALKDDPFGNQMVVSSKQFLPGFQGLQGPFYMGTGCFHRRKVIYGSPPGPQKRGDLSREELEMIYGNSLEFVESARQITSGYGEGLPANLSSRVEAAKKVAACAYEQNTSWGREIGWAYGSIVEDNLTGIRIHSMGWRSMFLTPEPPAFLGCAPTGGPASMTQHKRWATGLLEILLSRRSPILAVMEEKLTLRQCLGYLLILIWPLRSVFELCYALLPAYCLLAGSAFLPKASELSFLVPMAIFLIYNVYTLTEYFHYGLSIRAWWNNQRMQRIYAQTSWLLGFFSALLKILGFSETVFEVSRKDQQKPTDVTGADDPGRFTFDSSPVFVSGTAVMLINLAALVVGSTRVLWQAEAGELGPGIGEFVCSAWVLLSFWPFVKGLVRRGSYGIPWSVICKAAVPGCFFLQMCRNA